jgi:hypothetical protein
MPGELAGNGELVAAAAAILAELARPTTALGVTQRVSARPMTDGVSRSTLN